MALHSCTVCLHMYRMPLLTMPAELSLPVFMMYMPVHVLWGTLGLAFALLPLAPMLGLKIESNMMAGRAAKY